MGPIMEPTNLHEPTYQKKEEEEKKNPLKGYLALFDFRWQRNQREDGKKRGEKGKGKEREGGEKEKEKKIKKKHRKKKSRWKRREEEKEVAFLSSTPHGDRQSKFFFLSSFFFLFLFSFSLHLSWEEINLSGKKIRWNQGFQQFWANPYFGKKIGFQ